MKVRAIARELLAQVPSADVYFRKHFWSHWHFPEAEMRLLNALKGRPFDVALDIGAALGAFSWILDRKARRVIAFEPGGKHADFLARGIAGTRIELIRAAAGASNGLVPMYTPGVHTDALHSATLASHNPAARSDNVNVAHVRQIVLDEFLATHLAPSERIDFIKVDVEGYEQAVLEGALQTIQRHLPLLLCEIEARHNDDYPKTFSLIRDLGYESYIFRNGSLQRFDSTDISALQKAEDLMDRMSGKPSGQNRYINNFFFMHPDSTSRVLP